MSKTEKEPIKVYILKADGTKITWSIPTYPKLEQWLAGVSVNPDWHNTIVSTKDRRYNIYVGFWEIESGLDVLATAIRNRMEHLGWSITETAKQAGVDYRTARDIVTTVNKKRDNIAKILTALGVKRVELYSS